MMAFVADLFALVLLLLVLFLPFFIANSREHRYTKRIFWVNLLLGWTLIVWIPLIVYVLVSDAKAPVEKNDVQ